jgi:hypothetical protein
MSEPTGTPVPNQADLAWKRLQALRAEARELGIDVDDRWPIARLESEIEDSRRP